MVSDSGFNPTKTDFCGSHDLLIETFINKLGQIQDIDKLDKKELYRISIYLEKYFADKMPIEDILQATIPGIVGDLAKVDTSGYEQAAKVMGYGTISRTPYGVVMRVEQADARQQDPKNRLTEMQRVFNAEVQKERNKNADREIGI